MASHLVHLKLFSITNCSNVTHESIIPVLRSSLENGGLLSLTLDGVSTLFVRAHVFIQRVSHYERQDWSRFTEQVKEERLFGNLSTLTLTRPLLGWGHASIAQLISLTPLRELNLNNIGRYQSHHQNGETLRESKQLIAAVIESHGNTLETLGLLRVNIGDDIVAAICSGLPRLRRFFFTQSGYSAMVRSEVMYGLVTDRFF
jgi:hypothetical protein